MSSLAALVVMASTVVGQAEKPPHLVQLEAFAADFLGEWVNETTTDRDLPGVWKKGDQLVAHLKFDWASDVRLIEVSWWAEVNGKPAPVKAKGLIGWDSTAKQLAGCWFSSVGESGTITYAKRGDKWLIFASSKLTDGVRGSGVTEDEFVDNGNTIKSRRILQTLDGEAMPDKEIILKRK